MKIEGNYLREMIRKKTWQNDDLINLRLNTWFQGITWSSHGCLRPSTSFTFILMFKIAHNRSKPHFPSKYILKCWWLLKSSIILGVQVHKHTEICTSPHNISNQMQNIALINIGKVIVGVRVYILHKMFKIELNNKHQRN